MRRRDRLPLIGGMIIALSGCMSGRTGSIRYESAVRNARGTIALSDPKLYSRETLITERARDLAWLDRLIEESGDPTKVVFKPSLYREIELVTVLSASLGLKFDPAAALANQRSKALGETQQEYDQLKLQLQLDQLRTDAALFRKKLADQTEVATAGLGTSATGAPSTTSAVAAPDAGTLLTAIDGLVTSLNARMSAASAPIGKTEASSSPIDDFQDRLAYRNMLKAARNATGWDELQDAGNNRLIRLNFQATVVPEPGNSRALGAVQLKIGGGTFAPEYLNAWLRWINTSEPWRNGGNVERATIDALVASGDFEIARYPGPGGAGRVDVLMPVLVGESEFDVSPDDVRLRADWTNADDTDQTNADNLLSQLLPDGKALNALCKTRSPTLLSRVLDRAQAREQTRALTEMVNKVYFDLKLPLPVTSIATKYRLDQRNHVTLLGAMAKDPDCGWLGARYPIARDLRWKLEKNEAFGRNAQVRIYEVGPREQMQQVSTVARSATSLSLAASIAASLPQAGVGASVGAGYRRDLMTRASALDRVPEVVGYSVAGSGTFGWVFGPRATTDEKGRAAVEQLLRSYELSVDLSIPSWWSQMDVAVVKAWAPSPQLLVDGELAADVGGKGSAGRDGKILVPLPAAVADYQAFTQFLQKDGTRGVEISAPIAGGPVNACAATTLIIRGRNLWRADRVVLLGTSLGRDAIALSSEMQGIIVTVPAIPAIPGESSHAADRNIHVFTPFGQAQAAVTYQPSPSGDACKPKPAADATAPTTSSVEPASIVVPSTISLDVKGTNLAGVVSVKLGRQPGVIATPRPADGKSISIVFDEKATSGIDVGVAKLEFFAKDGKSVGTPLDVRVTRSRR